MVLSPGRKQWDLGDCSSLLSVSCTSWLSLSVTQSVIAATHSSPQPLTVMLCQSVLGSFWSVIPGLVTLATVYPLCTSYSVPLAPPTLLLHTSTTRICIQTLPSCWITVLWYKVFPFQYTYGHKMFPNTFIIFTWMHFVAVTVNQVAMNGSCCLCMCHVTAEYLVFPWIHHVISIMSPLNASCYSTSRYSASYTYTCQCIIKLLRVSNISTVVNL